MNARSVRALVRRDLLMVLRSRAVVIPLAVVPMLVLVAIPILLVLAPGAATGSGELLDGLTRLVARLPPAVAAELHDLDAAQTFVYLAVVYLMAPLYLVVPLLVATVIAADAFAGERERGTLEALLYTPTTDAELLLAKVLVAWLPAVAVALVGFVVYALVANLAAWPVMHQVFFPNLTWGVLVLFVAPAIAGLGLGVTVLVSARVRTFQEAQQLAGVVVLPLVALLIAQATGVLYLGTAMVAALGAGCWVACGVLLFLGTKTFRRGELMARRW